MFLMIKYPPIFLLNVGIYISKVVLPQNHSYPVSPYLHGEIYFKILNCQQGAASVRVVFEAHSRAANFPNRNSHFLDGQLAGYSFHYIQKITLQRTTSSIRAMLVSYLMFLHGKMNVRNKSNI